MTRHITTATDVYYNYQLDPKWQHAMKRGARYAHKHTHTFQTLSSHLTAIIVVTDDKTTGWGVKQTWF